MSEELKERIESQLEKELGFRWTPQMRHGHKALKMWNALVEARMKAEGYSEAVKAMDKALASCVLMKTP